MKKPMKALAELPRQGSWSWPWSRLRQQRLLRWLLRLPWPVWLRPLWSAAGLRLWSGPLRSAAGLRPCPAWSLGPPGSGCQAAAALRQV